MRTISYKLDDLKKVVIPIGYEGENNHTRVIIDAGEVFKQYPEAVVALTVQPPKGTMYPAIVTRDGDTVTWDVKDSDCASNGNGEAQFTFTNSTVVVKSVVTKIKVQRSLHTEGPAPDPIQNWLDTASETLEEADQAIEAATDAAAAAAAAVEDLEALDDITKAALAGDVGKALSPKTVENGVVTEWQFVEPGAGTDDYADLDNKPSIAGVTLSGNKTLEDLGIAADDDLDNLAGEVSDVKTAIHGISDDVDNLNDHETYLHGSIIEYEPVTENNHTNEKIIFINGYNYATFAQPASCNVIIYPVVSGKTYKVISMGRNDKGFPLLIVADNSVISGAIGSPGTYDYELGSSSSETVEEIEYTALRTGYLYINSYNSSCGLWLKKETGKKNYYMDDVRNNISDIDSVIDKITETKIDSASRPSKVVPRNAEPIAKVTSLANSVTLVRSILSRNVANKNAVGDVVVDSIGTTKKGIQTAWLPPGGYWIDLGNMGIYSMVKYFEKGVYSTTLWQDQFPMRVGITDPAGGFFMFYAENVSQLGDVSGLFVGKQRDGESVLPFEAYSEKTYTPEALADDNRIEVVPYGIIEFVNSSNSAVASTVEYTLFGKNDDTTTRKDFITSPDGTKFLPMIKDDGSVVAARVVPKKALFIGNSLTSGWQTFGEAATESDKDFVGRFGAVVADLDSDYTFNRKWSTQFEQQTSLANAQTWVTTNIDPLLDSDIDLIVVQLSDNVVGNDSARATFPSSSLWLLQHLRTECPKARVVWLGVWFDRAWVTTLLQNTAQTGCEYVDMRPIYLPENVSYIGEVYKMDSAFQKDYEVDSFTVEDGHITLVFTVDGKQYTSTIPSYTSYESSGSTLTVTGLYHVVSTYYESIHPNDEGFRKIANKLLFDLGISDSEETIPADA